MIKITIDNHIEFKTEYLSIERKEYNFICSLSGEFIEDGSSFDPPMTYTMTNVKVLSSVPQMILTPIYISLKFQRESGELDKK